MMAKTITKRMFFFISIAIVYACFLGGVHLLIAVPLAETAKFPAPTFNVSENNYSYVGDPKKVSSIPKNYYHAEVPDCANDVLELDYLLSNIKYPHASEPDIFDCSETAAFLERYLENLGYDAVIMTGARFSEGEKVYHAWVEVRNLTLNQSGKPVAMHLDRHEDTTYFALPSFYYREDQAYYKDIYEACESRWGFDEWDWWDVVK